MSSLRCKSHQQLILALWELVHGTASLLNSRAVPSLYVMTPIMVLKQWRVPGWGPAQVFRRRNFGANHSG